MLYASSTPVLGESPSPSDHRSTAAPVGLHLFTAATGMSTEPTFSSSMLADLEALARGEPLPGRDWSQRPWKIGEPCYTLLVGPGGDLHAYPCRVVTWDPKINVGTPEKPIPLMEAKYDSLNGWAMTLPQGTFKCLGLLPRHVDGEVW